MKRATLAALVIVTLLAPSARAMDAKPLLYSLLIPGMGEWSLGHKRIALTHFALEAGCWAGNFYYRDRGFELRHDYEAYAEAHWEEARWASAWSPDGQPDWMDWVTPEQWDAYAWPDTIASAMDFWRDGHQDYLESHFAPYQEDPQHYYENLGKYDWYRWGWDDYSESADDSANRYVYAAMRKDSNDAFTTAEHFIYALVVGRVVSLADTFLMLRRLEAGVPPQELDRGWRLEMAPVDPRESRFALALTRRW
ncbi:MAG: hypothetical protein H6693_01975 [Candidatus Latescibacteria bacterium]|nr:hypothetical protein [Candidatus Latescibacterota bacterium]